MGLSAAISDALERRKRRRKESRERNDQMAKERAEWRRRYEGAQARTANEIASLIAADHFEPGSAARRVPIAIRSKLAGADKSTFVAGIAELSAEDRQLLALAADGWTREEIASWLFRAGKDIRLDLRRIYVELGQQSE